MAATVDIITSCLRGERSCTTMIICAAICFLTHFLFDRLQVLRDYAKADHNFCFNKVATRGGLGLLLDRDMAAQLNFGNDCYVWFLCKDQKAVGRKKILTR